MGQFRGKRRQLIPWGRLGTEENGSIWLSEDHDARHIQPAIPKLGRFTGLNREPPTIRNSEIIKPQVNSLIYFEKSQYGLLVPI